MAFDLRSALRVLAGLFTGCGVLAVAILVAFWLSVFDLIGIKAALWAVPIGIIGGAVAGALVAASVEPAAGT